MEEGLIRVMALDIGAVRVGVAVSDALGLSAQPLPTIPRKPDEAFFERVESLFREWDVQEVVVGWPITLKGEQGGGALAAVRRVVEVLKQRRPDLRWIEWDERFTTSEAVSILSTFPKKVRERKGMRDQLAAQIILTSYLRSRSR